MTAKEQHLQEELDHLLKSWLVKVALWGALLFLAFAALDYVVMPERFWEFLVWRVGVSACLLVLGWTAQRLSNPKHHAGLAYLAVLGSAAMVEFMILRTGGQSSPYYVGMILLGSCALGLFPWAWQQNLGLAVGIGAIYALPILALERITDPRALVLAGFFIVTIFASTWLVRQVAMHRTVDAINLQYELAASEERLRLAMLAADQGLYDLNVQTGEVVTSEARVENWTGWLEKLHPEDRALVELAYQEYLSGVRQEYRVEYRQKSTAGEWKWFSALARWVGRDEQGHPLRLVGVTTDISQRKRMEAALLQARKLESLGVLAGGLAHNFNNLLGVILGNSSLAVEELKEGGEGALESMREIEVAARRGAELAQQMLAASGQELRRLGKVDVNAIAPEAVQFLRSMLGQGQSLKCELGPDLPLVEADEVQLREVLVALLENAIEAGGEEIVLATGVIELSGDELGDGEYLYADVVDTGQGMDVAVQEKVFDPFFTTKLLGRGLGLSAALGVIRAHGGSIRLTSSPGQGARFRVLLPVAR